MIFDHENRIQPLSLKYNVSLSFTCLPKKEILKLTSKYKIIVGLKILGGGFIVKKNLIISDQNILCNKENVLFITHETSTWHF